VLVWWRSSALALTLALWRLSSIAVHVLIPAILLLLVRVHPSALLVEVAIVALVVALVVSVVVILLVVLTVVARGLPVLLLGVLRASLVVVLLVLLLLLLLRASLVVILLVHGGAIRCLSHRSVQSTRTLRAIVATAGCSSLY